MTYAQMFREIAGRYDLDWRQLAAQAAMWSSFDAVAVGSQGSAGTDADPTGDVAR